MADEDVALPSHVADKCALPGARHTHHGNDNLRSSLTRGPKPYCGYLLSQAVVFIEGHL